MHIYLYLEIGTDKISHAKNARKLQKQMKIPFGEL